MEYLFKSVSQMAGYKVQNCNNIYNFIIDILELDKEKHKEIFQSMKKNIGLAYYEEFKYYANRKGYKYEY